MSAPKKPRKVPTAEQRAARKDASQRAGAAGKRFEQQVESDLAVMRATGLVGWSAHNMPAFRCVGPRVFVPVAKGGADFGGFFGRGAYAFALECKSVAGIALEWSEFTEGEREHLQATAAAGGVALVAVEFRLAFPSFRTFVVPWSRLPWREVGGGRSAHIDDLRGWEMARPEFLRRFVKWCARCQSWRPAQLPPSSCCLRGDR